MSQQINLLNLALRKKKDLLTAQPLMLAACLVLVLILILFSVGRQQAETAQAEADKRAIEVKKVQDQMQELARKLAEVKPSQALQDELTNARAMLSLREDVIAALEGGDFGAGQGFAEFLRGFARQVPDGLWLTGFTLNTTKAEIEMHGRMVKATALPEYLRRLNSEKAFQGRSFSSLLIEAPPEQKPTLDAQGKELPRVAPKFVEFILRTRTPEGQGKPGHKTAAR